MSLIKIYKDELALAGKHVEIFDGSIIPVDALEEFKNLVETYGWLTKEQILKTKLYKANKEWVEKLIDKGFEIIDIGDPYKLIESVFYEMEKLLIFGN